MVVRVRRRKDRATAVTGRTRRMECMADRGSMLNPGVFAVVARARLHWVWSYSGCRAMSVGDR